MDLFSIFVDSLIENHFTNLLTLLTNLVTLPTNLLALTTNLLPTNLPTNLGRNYNLIIVGYF